jgi:hypothetical protein
MGEDRIKCITDLIRECALANVFTLEKVITVWVKGAFAGTRLIVQGRREKG